MGLPHYHYFYIVTYIYRVIMSTSKHTKLTLWDTVKPIRARKKGETKKRKKEGRKKDKQKEGRNEGRKDGRKERKKE